MFHLADRHPADATQTVEIFESRRLPASFGVDLVRASCFVAQ